VVELLCALCMAFLSPGPEAGLVTYRNPEFGYEVAMRESFNPLVQLEPEGGMMFVDESVRAQLIVTAAHFAPDSDFKGFIKTESDQILAEGFAIDAEEIRAGAASYFASGPENNRYLRAVELCDGTSAAMIELMYPLGDTTDINVMIGELEQYFDATGC
jgi:hypothetical protein